jgi:pimeloyl-ACP methyl ester carboxylesterase
MGSFERDGLQFNYEEYGSGIPLIFSHGLGGNLTQARELIGTLEGVRVVIYDNRGHGSTSGTVDGNTLTFACMADDMAAVLDHLGIETAVVGGDSMGAGISIAFWSRHQRRVRRLILSRPAWLATPEPPNLAILGFIAKLIDDVGCEQAPARLEESAEFGRLKTSYSETAKSLMRTLRESCGTELASVYKGVPASVPFENCDQLSSIAVPTLILANFDDPIHPFAYARRLAAAIPSATLREIPSKNRNVDEHRRDFRGSVSEFIQAQKPQSP